MLPVVERFIRYAKIHTESDRGDGFSSKYSGTIAVRLSSLRGDAEK